MTALATVAVGAVLPLTPLGPLLGFVVPPWHYGVFVVAATTAYLLLVQIAKMALVRRLAAA